MLLELMYLYSASVCHLKLLRVKLEHKHLDGYITLQAREGMKVSNMILFRSC